MWDVNAQMRGSHHWKTLDTDNNIKRNSVAKDATGVVDNDWPVELPRE